VRHTVARRPGQSDRCGQGGLLPYARRELSAEEHIGAGLERVRARLADATARAGRAAGSVHLVAVSKAKPASAIRAAHAAGQRDFGENYVQELVQKRAELADLDGLRWHFIGGLQRNKARHMAGVALVHSVDRASLAADLARRMAADGQHLEVLVEVNVAGEAQKSGCAPDELPRVLEAIAASSALTAQGLMTVPPAVDDADAARRFFAELRALRDRHVGALGRGELSMGMSHDFEAAIAEGATLVRVGTAIFGAR
jgi:PLP dependent protein